MGGSHGGAGYDAVRVPEKRRGQRSGSDRSARAHSDIPDDRLSVARTRRERKECRGQLRIRKKFRRFQGHETRVLARCKCGRIFAKLGEKKTTDDQFHKLLLRFSRLPLVAFQKNEEPYDDVNPSFKVMMKPLETFDGSNPLRIVDLFTPTMKMHFSKFTIKSRKEVLVGGLKAAYVRMEYEMETQTGLTFPVSFELWVVPRVKHFFLIGAGMKPGDTDAKREIRGIVESIGFY